MPSVGTSGLDNSAAISHRAQANVAWFLNKHGRQLSRVRAPQSRIDLMTAENWLMRDMLLKIYKINLNKGLAAETLSYAGGFGGDPALLQSISSFVNHFFKPFTVVEPQHVVVGAGCSSILENLLYDVCDKDDGVLVEAPYWGGFDTGLVLRAQLNAIHVATVKGSQTNLLVDNYENALRSSKHAVKAILFCNPHNPRGTIYSQSQIEGLLKFCEKHDLHFISDEIYALSTFNKKRSNRQAMHSDQSPEFYSVLQMDFKKLGVNPSRVHMIYSISKDLGSSGLRMGFLVTQSHPDLRLSAAIVNHARVSTLTSIAVKNLLCNREIMEKYVRMNRQKLRNAAELVADFLNFHQLAYIPPSAGVYIWARLGGATCDWTAESYLNDQFEATGVSIGAGKGYYAPEPGWFRITFAVPHLTMSDALGRIEVAMNLKRKWTPNPKYMLTLRCGSWIDRLSQKLFLCGFS